MSTPVRTASSNQSLQVLACLLVFVFAISLSSTAQQSITLRFVDYETGEPIKKARVTAVWWNGTMPWNGVVTPGVQKIVAEVSIETGSDGSIKLPVPMPAPQYLEVSSPFDTVDGLDTQLLVSQVLERGVCVIADADNSPDSKLLPNREAPGEVLVVTRKLTVRDRQP